MIMTGFDLLVNTSSLQNKTQANKKYSVILSTVLDTLNSSTGINNSFIYFKKKHIIWKL